MGNYTGGLTHEPVARSRNEGPMTQLARVFQLALQEIPMPDGSTTVRPVESALPRRIGISTMLQVETPLTDHRDRLDQKPAMNAVSVTMKSLSNAAPRALSPGVRIHRGRDARRGFTLVELLM